MVPTWIYLKDGYELDYIQEVTKNGMIPHGMKHVKDGITTGL